VLDGARLWPCESRSYPVATRDPCGAVDIQRRNPGVPGARDSVASCRKAGDRAEEARIPTDPGRPVSLSKPSTGPALMGAAASTHRSNCPWISFVFPMPNSRSLGGLGRAPGQWGPQPCDSRRLALRSVLTGGDHGAVRAGSIRR